MPIYLGIAKVWNCPNNNLQVIELKIILDKLASMNHHH
jgi:hypothetical protein